MATAVTAYAPGVRRGSAMMQGARACESSPQNWLHWQGRSHNPLRRRLHAQVRKDIRSQNSCVSRAPDRSSGHMRPGADLLKLRWRTGERVGLLRSAAACQLARDG